MAEAGLAGARHANDDGVGRQVFRVVENKLLRQLAVVVHLLADVESAEFLEVLHCL